MTAAADVLTTESELESIREQWDRLAVETGRPFCAPAWSLAWWRNASPPGAAIRTIAIHDAKRLIGVAPLWVYDGTARRAHYDVMAGRLAPNGVLAAAGHEAEVAVALAAALARIQPKLSLLRVEGPTSGADLTDRVLRSWPGARPWASRAPSVPEPLVELDGGSYEDWLTTKSASFRRETKRNLRRTEEAGASFALASSTDSERAVKAFLELHAARWSHRGGSSVLVPGIEEMLSEAAREMAPEGRLRIFLLEVEDRPIAAQVLLAAGKEAACWQGGFDEEWGHLSPSAQLLLHAIGDASRRGESLISLGSGGQEYKRRIANDERLTSVIKLLPRGRGHARTRLRLLAPGVWARTGR